MFNIIIWNVSINQYQQMVENMMKFWLSYTFYLKNNFLLLPKWPKYTVFIFHNILLATDSIFFTSFVRWIICWRYALLPPIDRIQLGNFAFMVHVFLIYFKTDFLKLGHFGNGLLNCPLLLHSVNRLIHDCVPSFSPPSTATPYTIFILITFGPYTCISSWYIKSGDSFFLRRKQITLHNSSGGVDD